MLDRTGFRYRIRNFRSTALALGALAALSLPSAAAAKPVVDPSFDPGYGATERVYGAAFQIFAGWERKLVIGGAFTGVAGQPKAGLARLNEDGTLDPTFLAAGTDGTVWDLEVQNDNKILVAGSFGTINGVARPGFARLNVDGSLDTSFQARVSGTVFAVVRQRDGKVVVGGIFSQANGQPAGNIARFLTSGALDPTFQAGWGADSWINAIELDYNGQLVVGGNFTAWNGQSRPHLVRLLDSGAIDARFTATADGPVEALAYETNNRMLIGGSFSRLAGQPAANVGRVDSSGAFDASWNGGTDGTVEAIALDTFGNVLIGGGFSRFRGEPHANLVRVGPWGEIDALAELDTDGTVYRAISGVWGDLLAGDFRRVGGLERNRVARLDDSFPVVPGFDPATTRFGWINTTLPRPYGGGFLAGGDFEINAGNSQPAIPWLARLSAEGQVDPTFRPAPNGAVGALLDLADGSVLVGGEFTAIGGGARSYLARMLGNGAIDPAFPQSPQPVVAFARQADGKVLVATASRLTRIFPNGTADATFQPFAPSGSLETVAVQADGRILVAVNHSPYIGVDLSFLYRLLPNGGLDNTFYADFDSEVTAVALLPDGRILAGGHFDRVNGQPRPKLARLEADGALDPTFETRIGTAYGSVYSLTPLVDGRVVATGWIYSKFPGYPLCFACHFLPDGSVDPAGMEGFTAHEVPAALVLPDASIVLSHSDSGNYGGDIHPLAGRLLSPKPAEQELVFEFGRILWKRRGPLPELVQVKLEISRDGGGTWQTLAATRVEDGWRADRIGPAPYGTQFRASGNLVTGRYNGSSTMVVETLSIADPNAPPEQ